MRPVTEEKTFEFALFDFDGTLVETHLIYPFIHKHLLMELGVPEKDVSYITEGYWKREVADKDEHIDVPEYLSCAHGIDISPIEFRKRRLEIEKRYFTGQLDAPEIGELSNYLVSPVIADLHRLNEQGARCIIVSHNYGKVVDLAMRSLGLDGLFEDYYTQCGWKGLRHPVFDRNEPKEKTYKRFAEKATVPSKCIVYDDLEEHIQMAISLGMEAVKIDCEHARPPIERGKRC